jgi:hypothetical protein
VGIREEEGASRDRDWRGKKPGLFQSEFCELPLCPNNVEKPEDVL